MDNWIEMQHMYFQMQVYSCWKANFQIGTSYN
jgi:hypothetical protein